MNIVPTMPRLRCATFTSRAAILQYMTNILLRFCAIPQYIYIYIPSPVRVSRVFVNVSSSLEKVLKSACLWSPNTQRTFGHSEIQKDIFANMDPLRIDLLNN